jgi:hypothetical protein
LQSAVEMPPHPTRPIRTLSLAATVAAFAAEA